MCVGNFKDWHGLKHKSHAGGSYFALERADLVRRRLWAHYVKMAINDVDGCSVAVAPAHGGPEHREASTALSRP